MERSRSNPGGTKKITMENTKKQIKALKKDIVNNTAINVGYYDSLLNNLPAYAMLEAIKEITKNGLINKETKDSDIKNILITESIKNMNYQDFKDVSKFFFQ